MKTWFCVWTYVANYGQITVDAVSAEAAAELIRKGFSDDFQRKATIYVCPLSSVYVDLPTMAIKPDSPQVWDKIDTSTD